MRLEIWDEPKNDIADMIERVRQAEPGAAVEVPPGYRPNHFFIGNPFAAAGTRLEQFDATTQRVTQDRGAVYGHPSVDFDRIARLKSVVAECPDPLVRHALEMICVKIARLIQSPDHLDSLIDIAGYARCAVMVTDK